MVIMKGSAFLMPKAAGMSSASFDFAPRQIPECFLQGAFDRAVFIFFQIFF